MFIYFFTLKRKILLKVSTWATVYTYRICKYFSVVIIRERVHIWWRSLSSGKLGGRCLSVKSRVFLLYQILCWTRNWEVFLSLPVTDHWSELGLVTPLPGLQFHRLLNKELVLATGNYRGHSSKLLSFIWSQTILWHSHCIYTNDSFFKKGFS